MSTTMFDLFKLNERLLKSLHQFSLTKPTTIQEKVIPLAIKGNDLFITAPTGTGKTLSYILPSLNNLLANTQPGKGLQLLVIVPTRELALQTHKVISQMARYTFFESLLVTGGEGLQNQAAKLRKNPDIIVGTPGRLLEHWKKNQFSLDTLKVLVLDETDRILDMGFGDDVNTLIENCPSTRQTLLLSATKGNLALQNLISNISPHAVEIHLESNTPHQNISQQVVFADNTAHKERLVEWLLANESYQKTIIFTNTRQQANLLSKTFTATQIKHSVLHSDKAAEERKQIIHQLNQKNKFILIATDVAARGIDIPLLDLVINFDIPTTADEYTHRIGRTGRIENLGLAISLVTPTDWKNYLNLKKSKSNNIEERTIIPLLGKFKGEDTQSFYQSTHKKNSNKLPKPEKTTVTNTKPKTAKAKPSKLVSSDGFAPLKKKK